MNHDGNKAYYDNEVRDIGATTALVLSSSKAL
jgi:hypothetical protein